jgi:hypothetical protein
VGWQEAPVMPGNGCIMQRHARSSRKDQCRARGRAFMAVSFSFNKRFVVQFVILIVQLNLMVKSSSRINVVA